MPASRRPKGSFMRHRRTAVLLAVPTLALAACGGGDKSEIEGIVKDGAKDPSTICEHLTKDLIKQVGGTEEKCKKVAKAADDEKDQKVENLRSEERRVGKECRSRW